MVKTLLVANFIEESIIKFPGSAPGFYDFGITFWHLADFCQIIEQALDIGLIVDSQKLR